MNLIEAAMKYRQVTLSVALIMMLVGVYALRNMPRAENPNIDMPAAMVYAFYPGANEIQTEQQVTNKIEQYLFSFEEVDKEKTVSETKAGQAFITVHLYGTVKDRPRFWNTLQHGLNSNMAGVLPQGVIGPVVNSNFGDVSALIITLSSSQRDYAGIEHYLDKMEDGLKTIPSVSKINRSGGQKQQIYVTVDNGRMQQYGFDLSAIINMLQSQNLTAYSGELKIASNTIPLFTNSQFRSEAEIANQIIYTSPQGVTIRLKDVAAIERTYEEPSSFIRIGEDKVMVLNIEMQPGNNIVEFGEIVEQRLDEMRQSFPPDVKINTIVNQPETVDGSISHFMTEFILAIVACVVVVMLLLPFRVAAVASAAAPVAFLATFGVMNLIGIELHQVSLAALVIVLGMVIDNAIVIVDNYVEKLDEGIAPWPAAWQAAQQLAVPVITATLAIVCAFLPIPFFMGGVAKDFMLSLPSTIAIALFASLLVAFFLTPLSCYIFIKKGLKFKMADRKEKKKSMLDHLQHAFNIGIGYAFRWPKTTLAIGGVSVLIALFLASTIEQEFFPLSETKQFNVEVWLPTGTSLEETESVVKRVEEVFGKDDRVTDMASFVGTSSPRFNITYAPEMPRENFAQIFITTKSPKIANEVVQEYLPKFKDFVPDGYIYLRQLSMQEGSPIAVRIVGDNINDQKRVAGEVMDILEKADGTNWVRSNYQDDYFALNLQPKEDVATHLGVPNQIITQTLGAGLKGFTVSQMWEGDKPIDIYLRLNADSRKDFNDLANLHVNTVYGGKVLLKEVANLTPSWHTSVIAHKNGLRTLTVLAETQMGPKAATIIKKVKPEIDALSLPEGIRIEYGGDYESSMENAPSMSNALGVSLILIFMILMFQFKSVGKSLMVLATFPLSLLGAFLGLYITGNPISMTAFMGIISLVGIVVRNGIIIVDYADELMREHGHIRRAAALASAKRRMRPVFLTSAAAAVAVLPMILGKSPMWAPLGSVLASGLIVSMVLTLFVVPVLYFKFVKYVPKEQSLEQKHTLVIHKD